MPFDFWTELVNPADILPARYLRRPEAPPYQPAFGTAPQKARLSKSVQSVAREVHALHFKFWDAFAWKLRQILEPHPELAAAARNLIHETNCQFLKPLQDIGWRLNPQ